MQKALWIRHTYNETQHITLRDEVIILQYVHDSKCGRTLAVCRHKDRVIQVDIDELLLINEGNDIK